MTDTREMRIRVPVLARVEGEGALSLDIARGQVESLQLRIFEPPRLFEQFLRERSFRDLPDAVARICGICPVAYQMSAIAATERAFGVEVSPWVQAMRRLMYCGEWIQSHALHIHLLAAPDFLGFNDAVAMAKTHGEEVRRGLRLQELGNRIIAFVGGRAVHPVTARAGGFSHAPTATEAKTLLQTVQARSQDAADLFAWVSRLTLPKCTTPFVSVALRGEAVYPMFGRQIRTSYPSTVDVEDYESVFREHQVAHSTALHSHFYPPGEGGQGQPYLVGPLARLNLNHDLLPGELIGRWREAGLPLPSHNMFHSMAARALEIVFALDQAAQLLSQYTPTATPCAEVRPIESTAAAATEAPRGLLWHRYRFSQDGRIAEAKIVPPTSQNQARMEEDLRVSLQGYGLDRSEDELRRFSETVIRNYDPCISCATHFLRLRVNRR